MKLLTKLFLSSFIPFLFSCNDEIKTYRVERSFFKMMKEYYVLPKDTHEFNQTKNEKLILLGLSKDAYLINNKYYYKIFNRYSDGYICLNGFIRIDGEKVFLIAKQYDTIPLIDSLNREQLFLDFKANKEQNWDICFSNHIFSCVGIKFDDTLSLNNDLIYKYSMSQNLKSGKKKALSHASKIYFLVSKKYGFVNFIIAHENSARVISLLPEVSVRDTIFSR